MVRPGDLGAMPSWFVVLPDRESARTVRAVLSQHATQAIEHPSGRPWLMGRWRDGTVMTARAGETALALIGQQAETVDRLTGVAAQARTVADLDQFAASLAGSSHLVASVAGRVRIRSNQLFTAG